MKSYPTIDTLYLPDAGMRILDPETEASIMRYMEEVEIERRRNAAQAIIDSRNIVLF
jgi:hypothetical protein